MGDREKKWLNIHGTLKSVMYSSIVAFSYPVEYALKTTGITVIKEKSELKSNELKRFWSCWDLAFDDWCNTDDRKNYRKGETYKMLERMRNILFTIIAVSYTHLTLPTKRIV